MKTAIVIAGHAGSVVRQARELSDFIANQNPLCKEVEAWVLTDEEADLSSASFSALIDRVQMICVSPPFIAENYLQALEALYEMNHPQLMIFGSDPLAIALAARMACRVGGSSCAGARLILQENDVLTLEKKVYSNNLVARFMLKRAPYCISIAKNLNYGPFVAYGLPPIKKVVQTSKTELSWLREVHLDYVEEKEELGSAKTVVAIGQGIGSKEKAALFFELASLLHAKLGASRPVVMNAWVGMEHLIGASGAVIAPDLCLAIGVSGSAAFSVGIEKSNFIIAINRDEKAPIFKIADVGISAEYQEIVSELIKILIIDKQLETT